MANLETSMSTVVRHLAKLRSQASELKNFVYVDYKGEIKNAQNEILMCLSDNTINL